MSIISSMRIRNKMYYLYPEFSEYSGPALEILADFFENYKNDIIICKQTAAECIPLTNISYDFPIQIYSKYPIDFGIHDIDVEVIPDCFDVIEYDKRGGLFVTTAEETLRTMIRDTHCTTVEAFYSSLANYYFHYDQSWEILERTMTDEEKILLDEYKYHAEHFYDRF